MCGRYTLAASDLDRLRGRFPLGADVPVSRRFNVAPGDEVLAVVAPAAPAARGELLRWGLVPPWTREPLSPRGLINARAETVRERRAFAGAFTHSRCLIIADGFFEWQRDPGRPPQPFHIARADRRPFAFAGLWSQWRSGPKRIKSCAIITTAASPAIAPLHQRMPVILPPAAEGAWLDPGASEDELMTVLETPDADDLVLRPVSRVVNDASHDEPDCLLDAEPALRPDELTLF